MAASRESPVLQHPGDASMEAVSACVPERNLRDLTYREDHLMELLMERGMSRLTDQYWSAIHASHGDGLGDYEYVKQAMARKGLRYDVLNRKTEPGGYFSFVDNETYGMYVPPSSPMVSAPDFQQLIELGSVVPRDTGKLILTRQMYFFERLSNIVDDIITTQPDPRRTGWAAGDLVLRGRRQNMEGKTSLEARLAVLSSNPALLSRDVESWFSSRPELVPDDSGRSLPGDADKHANAAVLDTLHNAVKSAAAWSYVTELLERAESGDADSYYRGLLLQEISNVCHYEFAGGQSALRRHVSKGSKWFRRVPDACDAAGNVRTTVSGRVEGLAGSDPQLYYVLRLCHQDTTAAKAGDWLEKLSDLHKAQPAERERISEAELGALAELSSIVGYIRDMSFTMSLPPLWTRGELKKDLDLGDYAVPASKLSEPGAAEGALDALNRFVVDKAGTKLGFLYEDLIDDCFSFVQKQYEENRTKPRNQRPPLPMPARKPREMLVEQRRAQFHGATRATALSDYEIAPRRFKGPAAATEDTAGMEAFQVSPATAEVFGALFGQTEPVSWRAFKDAMVELEFSVLSKDGLVFTG
ncbi:ipa protein [Colletotrichum sojae]|uniref:Ipa protein n=1 Tax=Colletotrichum sojae TaxID=2175907 RepID=A0A8H6MLP9_9PEZI|nr:ipa protein [Colletotrichum sojae]